MPTRIVLKESTAPSRLYPPRVARRGSFHTPSPLFHSKKTYRHSILSEKSGISVSADFDLNDDDAASHNSRRHLSSSDIRASTRLLGYVFAFIACAIMLASVILFYRSGVEPPPEFEEYFDSSQYFVTPTGSVLHWWKMWGAMGVSGLGCIVYLFIVLAHFDTICFPQVWVRVFRDGSLSERNLILLLIFYWFVGLHINTSSLSVGENQPNVFFTSWIAFVATAYNYVVWRESAGLSCFFFAKEHQRETTENWLWTSLFSTILAGAVTDIYIYRNSLTITLNGQNVQVEQADWVLVLSLVWAEVFLCALALFLNEFQVEPYKCPCRFHRQGNTYRCVFGWRQIEGFIILLTIGGKYYVVLNYTGVDTVINGLTNAYVGAWGTLFASIFTFGTWLRESRNVAYFTGIDEANDDPAST